MMLTSKKSTIIILLCLLILLFSSFVDARRTTGYWADVVITFNATVTDDTNLTQASLYGNWGGGWHLNETNSSGINGDYIFTKNFTDSPDGIIRWRIEAYDWCNNSRNSSIWDFRIDTTHPEVNLVSSANASIWSSSNIVTFTYNVTDVAINYCYLVIDDSIVQINYLDARPWGELTTNITTNQTFTQILADGNYEWSVRCIDTCNLGDASETWELTVDHQGYGGAGAPTIGDVIKTSKKVMDILDKSLIDYKPIKFIKLWWLTVLAFIVTLIITHNKIIKKNKENKKGLVMVIILLDIALAIAITFIYFKIAI